MDKEYYSRYYIYERQHWWFRIRSKIIEERISKISRINNRLKILNIGVATGQTSIMMSRFGEVTSVENDLNTCHFLKDELNINAIHASITQLPFNDATFDLVCAFDVIEHVKDDNSAIDEMYRVSKPAGVLFITVPAYMHLWSRNDEINHHFRRYCLKQLVELLRPYPGKIIYQSYFNSLLYFPILLIRKLLTKFSYLRTNVNDSDFEAINIPVLNYIAYLIFTLEKFILKYLKMPFGVSIMVLHLKTINK